MDTDTGPARYGPQRSAPGRLQRRTERVHLAEPDGVQARIEVD